jgi:hypothetical protein
VTVAHGRKRYAQYWMRPYQTDAFERRSGNGG